MNRLLSSKFLHCQKRTLTQKNSYNFAQICSSAAEALRDVKDGSRILMGGFGICGIPENSILEIKKKGVKDLFIASNTCGVADWGLGLLLQSGQIKRVAASYVGENPVFEKLFKSGQLEVELIPQGTLAEKMRSGGMGIPAFYTPTGVGTYVEYGKVPVRFIPNSPIPDMISKPKERRVFNGRAYIMEETLTADFSIVKAQKADRKGNLYYNRTARNFNEDAVLGGKIAIAEVEEIVENGELDPDLIHTPGVFVDRVFVGEKFERRFEKLVYDNSDAPPKPADKITHKERVRNKIVARAAKEVKSGMNLNLGIGMPTLLP